MLRAGLKCFLLLIFLFVSLATVPGKKFVFADSHLDGDWIVSGTESYYGEVFVLNGNLIVEYGGNLTFRKVTLKMNCTYDGQYNVTVKHGGSFYVLDGSVITSVDPDSEYLFLVDGGSTFRMNNTELHECGWFAPAQAPNGLNINSEDAIIENSLLSHNAQGVNIWSNKKGVIVRNNSIKMNEHVGIGLWGSSAGNATIANNNISLNPAGGIHAETSNPTIVNNTIVSNGEGISCWKWANPTIRDNVIAFNDGNGLIFSDGCNPIIQGNNITSNNAAGIVAQTDCSGAIERNIITNNQDWAISINHNCSMNIQENTIMADGGGIDAGHHSNTTIQGNIIKDITWMPSIHLGSYCTGIIVGNLIANNQDGIVAVNHSNPLIQGNIITSNGGVGVKCESNSLPEVHWNDIYNNAGYGVQNKDSSITINATHNYWGSKSGPVQSSPDAVDPEEVSQNILYNPWLTESIFLVEIMNPLASETVSATVKVTTDARAKNGIYKVEFYMDDQLVFIDHDVEYEWNWDTTQYTETEHKITVKAYDVLGLKVFTSITVFIDNTPPTVLIKEPTTENIYSGTIGVSVSATDNQELGNVHARVDNSEWLVMTHDPADLLWKYDLNTTTLSDGQHTLTVLALDRASNPATNSTTLVTDNNSPTLTIQTPQGGTTVGLTLIVDVQASDAIGISRIEFYLGNVLVYTVNKAPYEWSWDTTKYPNGEYVIAIKAYDVVGNMNTTETTVTVQNVEPSWWETHFWTIIQVLIGIGGLIVAILAYLTRTGQEKKKKK